jgi:hypothetical protein
VRTRTGSTAAAPAPALVYPRAALAFAAPAGALPEEEITASPARVRLLLFFLKLPLSSSTSLCGLRDCWGNHHHRAAGRDGAPGHRRRRARQGRRAVRGRAQGHALWHRNFRLHHRPITDPEFLISSGRAQKRSISTACVAIRVEPVETLSSRSCVEQSLKYSH